MAVLDGPGRGGGREVKDTHSAQCIIYNMEIQYTKKMVACPFDHNPCEPKLVQVRARLFNIVNMNLARNCFLPTNFSIMTALSFTFHFEFSCFLYAKDW